ncbi:MAG TPA: hypothetical protein VLS90_06475 [Thermodesulfobacteriota bacterium]|nr:hypothetical protein [Thermodesulfobacteriota bacterium]
MTRYRHRQFGRTLVYILGGGAAVSAAVALLFPLETSVAWVIAVISAASAALFSSLCIEITRTHLRWFFGPGIFRKQVLLSDISDAEATRTKFLEGWGIHLTRRGWLFNVSGLTAVAVKLKSGKQFLLGSDDADRLAGILRETARSADPNDR